jgi:hypothetical protein
LARPAHGLAKIVTEVTTMEVRKRALKEREAGAFIYSNGVFPRLPGKWKATVNMNSNVIDHV